MALSRCWSSIALFVVGAEGARVARHRGELITSTKFIAGTPVLNYQEAYSLGEVAGEAEQEWILMMNAGTSDTQIDQMCKTNANGCNLVGHPSKSGVPFLEMRGTEQELEEVIHSSKGAVRYVEPDNAGSVIPEIEADPEAATWGLNRIGADQRGRNGAGVTVFVLDTGVRTTHQEFTNRASTAMDISSGYLLECSGDLSCAVDRQGHGTHCAGTAAGKTYGVAPSAKVKAVKCAGDSGSFDWSWIIATFDWLAVNEERPAVASVSLGGNLVRPSVRFAVDAAVNAGVVVVVAAGNSDADACGSTLAHIPTAITVGSTTSLDARSSYSWWGSCWGSCVNIWAPGSSVLSAGLTSDTASDTKSGTSMACPHVSGAAALVLEADPSKKPSAVLQDLLDTAFWNAISGLKFNDTNALLSVMEGGAPPAPTPAPTPAPPPGTWEITGSGCEADGDCIQSLNHPSDYGEDDSCSVLLGGSIDLTTVNFRTEHRYDILSVGGVAYSGTNGPPSGPYSGTIKWSSDHMVISQGWRLCRT